MHRIGFVSLTSVFGVRLLVFGWAETSKTREGIGPARAGLTKALPILNGRWTLKLTSHRLCYNWMLLFYSAF